LPGSQGQASYSALQDLRDEVLQAKVQLDLDPFDPIKHAQHVLAMAWYLKAKQHVGSQPLCYSIPDSFVKAVRGGPHLVHKWLTHASCVSRPQLTIETQGQVAHVMDFISQVSTIDDRCSSPHDVSATRRVAQLLRDKRAELSRQVIATSAHFSARVT
jgi:hypothetical protein